MKYYLVFVLLSFGCARVDVQLASAAIKPYVEDFQQNTGIEFVNTDILLANIPPTDSEFPIKLGLCYPGVGINVILLNTDCFNNNSETNKKTILAHEIGHCVIGLGHNDKLLDDGCPESVMHPQVTMVLTDYCWGKYEYYEELIEAYKNFGGF